MPAKNISNQNGRALEYKIVDYLCSKDSFFNVELSKQALSDLQRDKLNFDNLTTILKDDYLKCAEILNNWLWEILKDKNITIHKLTDQEAKKGDVTDIRVSCGSKVINLSIKHNHMAVKHQRPPTTAIWCGCPKGSSEDKTFREELDKIYGLYTEAAKKLLPIVENFRDLKKIDDSFVNREIYNPVCNLVAKTLEEICNNPKSVESLFTYLVGKIDYYKIIDTHDKVVILDFTNVTMPDKVLISRKDDSYILLKFSNGWEISMRVHTAASAFGKSLKFDSQPTKTLVKDLIINK